MRIDWITYRALNLSATHAATTPQLSITHHPNDLDGKLSAPNQWSAVSFSDDAQTRGRIHHAQQRDAARHQPHAIEGQRREPASGLENA